MHVEEDWNQRSKSLKRNSKLRVRLVLSRLLRQTLGKTVMISVKSRFAK